MTIMSKRGQADNVLTYEHICDFESDLATIDPRYITLGSVAIVLHGSAGFSAYMADSNKTWIPLVGGGIVESPSSHN